MRFILGILTSLAFMGCAPAFAQTSNHTDLLQFGKPSSGANKNIEFNVGSGGANPKIRWSVSGSKLQFSNDGTNFFALNPLTALGDMVYGGASGAPTVLSGNITTTPLVLTMTGTGSVAAAPVWGVASSQLVAAAKVTTYAVQPGDEVLFCSSSAFTMTLPTAVGVAGKSYYIVKTDASLTNICTIATTSAQTIGGFSSVTANTLNESWRLISDGANWQIASHYTDTAWTSYTPSGCGGFSGTTCTNYNFYWRRVGSTLTVRGTLTTGTVQSALGSIAIPTNTTIDNSKFLAATTSGPCVSVGKYNAANLTANVLVCTTTSTSLLYTGANTSVLTPVFATAGGGSSTVTEFEFDIPISGWLP